MANQKASKIRLKSKERLNLFTDLSTMLTAGIPILEAVQSLEKDAKGNFRKTLARMRLSLNNGEPLSHIMATMPHAFDQVSVNLVHAAETGGTLETTLKDLTNSTKKEMAFSSQLRDTMIYPAFVMVVFFGIIILMLTFVIPRVAKVFSKMDVNMPWVTKAMIAASNAFTAHWPVIIGGIVALIIFVSIIISANKRAIVRLVMSLPFLRTLGTNIDFTRFTRSFGLLMRAGVPIVEALDLSEKTVQKKRVANLIRQMKHDVAAGRPLAASLRSQKSGAPLIMSRSIETAETSGTLEETMQNLNEYFDEQVSSSLKVLGSLVEPVLLVVVGGMVGVLIITIIAPIYNMISQINPQK
jgi:type II secretory pathway component PulF